MVREHIADHVNLNPFFYDPILSRSCRFVGRSVWPPAAGPPAVNVFFIKLKKTVLIYIYIFCMAQETLFAVFSPPETSLVSDGRELKVWPFLARMISFRLRIGAGCLLSHHPDPEHPDILPLRSRLDGAVGRPCQDH